MLCGVCHEQIHRAVECSQICNGFAYIGLQPAAERIVRNQVGTIFRIQIIGAPIDEGQIQRSGLIAGKVFHNNAQNTGAL